MFRTRFLGLGVVVWLLCGVAPAFASPVSYQFSGTLAQPYSGSSQFSGTFTYDTDLPLNAAVQPIAGSSYYSGVPADPTEPVLSLAFKIGNTTSSTLGAIDSDEVIVTHNSANDGFYIEEYFPGTSGGQGLLANIGMINNNLVARGPFSSTSLPASLDLASFSMGAQLDLTGTDSSGQPVTVVGTITSLEPLTVPEPSSLLVFAILGAGACGLDRVRRALAADRDAT